ncbi:hypothetical protein SeMB42_g06003 [Synchytrium endobioticum]|uniref:Uncharacterized protein n=1 Tax=Synchytrium endobioticum TaxID=286115 RepID=A0A507CL22_9FUNG|nr:hypothetical protein SeLEV6574_g07296 [Synchytrium endobioticum]TPX40448.1 hypothetical protein SeMB42_g06003 [Synchytrium endobioticum]
MLAASNTDEINGVLPLPSKSVSFLSTYTIGSGAPIIATLKHLDIDLTSSESSPSSSAELIEQLVRYIQDQDSKIKLLERRIADLSFDRSTSRILSHQKTASSSRSQDGKTPLNSASRHNEEVLDATPPSVRKLFPPHRVGDRGRPPSILQPSYPELEATVADLNHKIQELETQSNKAKKEARDAKLRHNAKLGILSDLVEARNQRIKVLESCGNGSRKANVRDICTQTQDPVEAGNPLPFAEKQHGSLGWDALLKKVENTRRHRRSPSVVSSSNSNNSMGEMTETTVTSEQTATRESVSTVSTDQRMNNMLVERSVQFKKFMDAKKLRGVGQIPS